jgi:quinoprotein glucose dehydrogenase
VKSGICFLAALACAHAQSTHLTWSDYGGAPDSAQYSALTQINRTNVTKLKVAWRYPTGDANKYFFNPLAANGLLYVLAKNNSIVALDQKTGKEIWTHPTGPDIIFITNRGINYWESPDHRDRRLIFAVNNKLQAIDAITGATIPGFGADLRENLGRDPGTIAVVQSLTPGKVFENLLIVGSATNQEYDSAPGDIRAYDVRTGKLAWSFHTVPHPGEYGYDSWPKDAWKTVGGANAWGELTLDEKRGIIYIPTGSPKYNFYGADRPGANLYGDCLLALNARTGQRIWHYQMVHHDIWDYDNATAPKLLTIRHNGKLVDVVAQPGKMGFLWVFNRDTGAPIWPIEERPVPKSDMPNEKTWPTQPFPTAPPPFARQKFTADDINPYIPDPAERAKFRDAILSARNEGIYTPPGIRGSIQMPGNNGGSNWSNATADADHGLLYVLSKDLPSLLKLEADGTAAAAKSGSPEEQGQFLFNDNCARCHKTLPGAKLTRDQIRTRIRTGNTVMPAFSDLPDAAVNQLTSYLRNPVRAPAKTGVPDRYKSSFGFMIASNGLSAIKPPWTSVTAYDLNEGTVKWKIALGDAPETPKGTGTHYPKVGPVATAGGLIFAGTKDRKVRALDSDTGSIVWETEVSQPMEGIPAIYEAGGKQYIVFCAAAPGAPGAKIAGEYVAFALPD